MIFVDAKTSHKYERQLARVLVLDGQASSARFMVDLLKDIGARRVLVESLAAKALERCRSEEPQIIFTGFGGAGLDGVAFVRALRRSDFACRQAPVIMVTAEATAQVIMAARDAGVHEFLRKPFTIKDLLRRIEAVTGRSRDWVEAVGYVGPDRRRFNSADYQGKHKRKSDEASSTDAAKIDQALRILKSAMGAIESDPAQSLRSMQAQATALTNVAMSVADARLATGAAGLQQRLKQCIANGVLDRVVLETAAEPLWAYLPADGKKAG